MNGLDNRAVFDRWPLLCKYCHGELWQRM